MKQLSSSKVIMTLPLTLTLILTLTLTLTLTQGGRALQRRARSL